MKKEIWLLILFVAVLEGGLCATWFGMMEKEHSEIITAVQEQTAEQVELQQSIDQLFYDMGESLGGFVVTYYCPCEECVGETSITTSGLQLEPGMCAVDPSVIPLGSKLLINGQVYTATDTGPDIMGNRVDLCVATHEQAIDLGVKTYEVWLLKGVNYGK